MYVRPRRPTRSLAGPASEILARTADKGPRANNQDRANRSGIPPELVREPRIRRVELCNLVQLHW